MEKTVQRDGRARRFEAAGDLRRNAVYEDADRSNELVRGRRRTVVNSDTLWLDGQSDRIRVWGLDVPKTNAPGGPAATAAMAGSSRSAG